MEPALQYDMFEETTPEIEQNHRIDCVSESLNKLRKRYFAEKEDLVRLILKQQKEIDAISNRLDKVLNKMIKEVK